MDHPRSIRMALVVVVLILSYCAAIGAFKVFHNRKPLGVDEPASMRAVAHPADVTTQPAAASPASSPNIESHVDQPAAPATETDCYESDILRSTVSDRQENREQRERIKASMDAKIEEVAGMQVTLSGSDQQNLTFSAKGRWPEDRPLIEEMAQSLEQHTIDALPGSNFCQDGFSKIQFVTYDYDRQTLHVIWSLQITKNGYKDVTLNERIKNDVLGR